MFRHTSRPQHNRNTLRGAGGEKQKKHQNHPLSFDCTKLTPLYAQAHRHIALKLGLNPN